MATNVIKVEFGPGNELKTEVWDSEGTKHDIYGIFEYIVDRVDRSQPKTRLALKHQANSMKAEVEFNATQKVLEFTVHPSVIRQILEMKEA